MPFAYVSPIAGSVRQGEILGPVWSHRVDAAAAAIGAGREVGSVSVRRELVIVMQADCDIAQDFPERDDQSGLPRADAKEARLLPGLLLCDLFHEGEMRARLPVGSEVFKRVRQNENERYHCLPAATLNADPATVFPEYFLDFKRAFMETPESLYPAIFAGSIKRHAIVPSVYLQDLMHRFFGFHSRVGWPD